MTVKANGGRCRSLRPLLCAASLLLCGAAAAQQGQGSGQTGTSQSSQSVQPSITQTGTASQTKRAGDASRGQPQQTQGATGTQTQGTTGTQTQGAPVGGTPTVPGVTLPGRSQLPGAARVTQGPTSLSLEQAIQLAIQNNLTTLVAREREREAEGLKDESRAGLLPNVSGTAYQANITQNLAALGFQPGTFPGITRTFIGPFNTFDARARLVQSIFSLSAIRNYQAGKAGVRVAELQEGLAREQVATFTALTYLEALRSGREVLAVQADVDLAQTLLKLAQDQHAAGVATGVDVTRAETRLAQERVRLSQAQTASEQAVLNLQRVVGLPLGAALTLADPLRFTQEPLPAVETAVEEAGQARPEVRIAEAQLSLTGLERSATRAELLPSVDFVGDNVVVVTAQAALSDARSSEVTALAQYNAARLNLAAALGRAERFRW